MKLFLLGVTGRRITDDEVDDILYSVDTNLDGAMDFTEFVRAAMKAGFDPSQEPEPAQRKMAVPPKQHFANEESPIQRQHQDPRPIEISKPDFQNRVRSQVTHQREDQFQSKRDRSVESERSRERIPE